MAEKNIKFISEKHKAFYMEKMQNAKFKDVYHQALYYCLGVNVDTRFHFENIFDEEIHCVRLECLQEGWQTSGSLKVVRMAFNLFCNGNPTVNQKKDAKGKLEECRRYSVEELFACEYAPFFWQAIQLRYPEYAVYNNAHAELFGSED